MQVLFTYLLQQQNFKVLKNFLKNILKNFLKNIILPLFTIRIFEHLLMRFAKFSEIANEIIELRERNISVMHIMYLVLSFDLFGLFIMADNQFHIYNHGNNIFRLFDDRPNFSFTVSEAKHDY